MTTPMMTYKTAALAILLAAAGMPALARPPTVMNSPGYDARLAESRKARAAEAEAEAAQAAAITVHKPLHAGKRKPSH